MGHVRGESRDQSALFPVSLDELIPADHVSRVIDAFAARLDRGQLALAKPSPVKGAKCTACHDGAPKDTQMNAAAAKMFLPLIGVIRREEPIRGPHELEIALERTASASPASVTAA